MNIPAMRDQISRLRLALRQKILHILGDWDSEALFYSIIV